MSQITEEQIGEAVINFIKAIGRFLKSFFYGIGEIISSIKEKERKPLVIGFFILLILSFVVYFSSEILIKYIPNTEYDFINEYFIKSRTIKIIAILTVVLYIKSCGDKKVKFLNSFNDKFQAIGLHSKLMKERIDSNGNKIKIRDYPKLLKTIKKDEITIYMFGSNGVPLSTWQKKIQEIESTFGFGVLEVANKKGSSKVIRLVTAPYEVTEKIRMYNEKFETIGLYTKIDGFKNYPELLEMNEEGKKVIYKFKTDGIPVSTWKEKKNEIEVTFDTNLISINYVKNTKKSIEMVTVPSKYNLEESYTWSEEFIPEDDFKVVLGEGLLERPIIDFNKTPHLLIAGLTGSGKSVLERCIAWQGIKKGAKPYLIDFKGGLELGDFEDFGEVVFERKRVIQILDGLEKEHHARIEAFKKVGVKNIVEYNKKVDEDEKLCRVFLVVDEIGELLDTTGVKDKKEKDIYEAIERKLNVLARLGRASGINMILATQRPDAKVIKGQIKNNLGARISGRMTDKEPSIMVLGSPDAKDLPDIGGRFLFSLGADPIKFQGYWFKKDHIIKGNYEKGIMLVDDNKQVQIKGNTEVLDETEYIQDELEYPEEVIKEAIVEKNKEEIETNEKNNTEAQSYKEDKVSEDDENIWTIVDEDDIGELVDVDDYEYEDEYEHVDE